MRIVPHIKQAVKTRAKDDARGKMQYHFDGEPLPHWTRWLQGTGRMEAGESILRLVTWDARAGEYSDAQLDDYHGLRRSQWPWRPPLRMSVRARASQAEPVGTAGFGFWNDPFTLSGRVLALPEAVWFFYASPPSDMALVPDVPGRGWKASVVNTTLAGALLSGLPTALAVLWARLTGPARAASAARWVQRISGAHEAPLHLDWTAWHTYELEWLPDVATFWVNGSSILRAPHPPAGPLGFVTWVDNQFAIATPRGEFRFGTLDAPGRQWLELDWIQIETKIHDEE